MSRTGQVNLKSHEENQSSHFLIFFFSVSKYSTVVLCLCLSMSVGNLETDQKYKLESLGYIEIKKSTQNFHSGSVKKMSLA